MDDIQLKKLKKRELINQLVENNERRIELEEKLEKKDVVMENAGSMAHAALQLSGIFEAADDAAVRYLESLSASIGAENARQIRKMYEEIKAQKCSAAFEAYEADQIEQAKKRTEEYEEQLREDARTKVKGLEADILNKIRISVNEYSVKIKEKLRATAEEYESALLEEVNAQCEEKLRAAEEQAHQIIVEADTRSKQAMQSTEQKCRERELKMQDELEEYGNKMKEIKEKYQTLLTLFDSMPDKNSD